MELVRQMLRQNFGNDAVAQGNEILNKLFDEQKREGWTQFKQTVRQCCGQINQQMDYSQRLQLLNYLVMVAQADGSVPQSEVTALFELYHYQYAKHLWPDRQIPSRWQF